MEACRCASENSDVCVCLWVGGVCVCVCAHADEKRKDRERQRGRGSLLACCIYGHFLSSLNRAGCAGNLRSLLQMVCIMFKPPCHHPSLSLFPSFSLPYAINHQNPKLFLCCLGGKKTGQLFTVSLQKGIGKGCKRVFRLQTLLFPNFPPSPPTSGSSLVPTGSSAWTCLLIKRGMKVRASGRNLAEALMGRVKREPRLLPKPPVFTSVKAVGAKLSSGSEHQIVDQVILLGCSHLFTLSVKGFFLSFRLRICRQEATSVETEQHPFI